MATHGSVGAFEDGREEWTSYTERLQQYFTANDIKTAEKQRAILLSVCGATTYQLIRNLTAPGKPTDHTFQQLVQLVQSHRTPPPSVTVQRFTFNTRSQKEGETVAQFVAELRRLSEHCHFEATLDDMLRDRLVCGVRDVQVQRRLLAEPNLQESLRVEPVGRSSGKERPRVAVKPEAQSNSACGLSPVGPTERPYAVSPLLPMWRQAAFSTGLPLQNS